VLAFAWSAALQAQGEYCFEGRFGPEDTLFAIDDVVLDFDVDYGQALDWQGELDTLRMDIYAPRPSLDSLERRPLIVYFHGGGFWAGSKFNQKGRDWAIAFARRGYVFASVDYRLGWPNTDSCAADTTLYMRALWRASQDARAAWRFLADTAQAYSIDTGQVFLLGTSAGSAAVMTALYGREQDFAPYLVSELGPLDGSGNDRPAHSLRPKGVVTKSAGMEGLYALPRWNAPHLFFHGTCDLTAPFFEGPLFYCYAPYRFVYAYGSARIAEALTAEGRCHTLYANIGQGHGAVADDTVVVYGAAFISGLLCDTCALPERIERLSAFDACAKRTGERTQIDRIFPNPSDGRFQLVLSGPGDSRILLEIIDARGRIVYQDRRDFVAPIASWSLDFSGLASGMYLLRAGNTDRFTTYPLVIRSGR
jgi:acetyl esterase/lipase